MRSRRCWRSDMRAPLERLPDHNTRRGRERDSAIGGRICPRTAISASKTRTASSTAFGAPRTPRQLGGLLAAEVTPGSKPNRALVLVVARGIAAMRRRPRSTTAMRAKTGRSPTAWRIGYLDPLLPLPISSVHCGVHQTPAVVATGGRVRLMCCQPVGAGLSPRRYRGASHGQTVPFARRRAL